MDQRSKQILVLVIITISFISVIIFFYAFISPGGSEIPQGGETVISHSAELDQEKIPNAEKDVSNSENPLKDEPDEVLSEIKDIPSVSDNFHGLTQSSSTDKVARLKNTSKDPQSCSERIEVVEDTSETADSVKSLSDEKEDDLEISTKTAGQSEKDKSSVRRDMTVSDFTPPIRARVGDIDLSSSPPQKDEEEVAKEENILSLEIPVSPASRYLGRKDNSTNLLTPARGNLENPIETSNLHSVAPISTRAVNSNVIPVNNVMSSAEPIRKQSNLKSFEFIQWQNCSCFIDTILFSFFAVWVWMQDSGYVPDRSNTLFENYFDKIMSIYSSAVDHVQQRKQFETFSTEIHREIRSLKGIDSSGFGDYKSVIDQIIPDHTVCSIVYRYGEQEEIATGCQNSFHSAKNTAEAEDWSNSVLYRSLLDTAAYGLDLRIIAFPKLLWLDQEGHSPYIGFEDQLDILEFETELHVKVIYDLVCIGTRPSSGHVETHCRFHNSPASFLQRNNLVSNDLDIWPVFHHGMMGSEKGKAIFKGNSFDHVNFTASSKIPKPITFSIYVKRD